MSDAGAVASDADAVAKPIAVVFDLDGTLVDTMHSMPRAYADTIRALGGPAVTPDDVVATWHIGPTSVVLAHFLGRPAEPSDLDCFRRRANAAASVARAFPGVAEMLERLDEADCRLGIFTSATRHSADRVLAASGLVGYFPVVVCGDEAPSPKPAPDGLVLACASLGVPVSDTVYVGDAVVDLQCAGAAGAHGIHAGWGGSLRVDSPHVVARTPGEVLELLTRLLGGRLGLAG